MGNEHFEAPQFGGECLCGHSEEEHGAGGECEAIGCDCVEFNNGNEEEDSD